MADIIKSIRGRQLGFDVNNRLMVDPALAGSPMPVDYLAYNAIAASTAITSTASETVFDKYATIQPNTLAVGSLIRIRFQGIATATTSSDTLAVKLYIHTAATLTGGTTLISIAATDATNNDIFTGEYELAIRTVGSSGTMVGVGTFKSIPGAEGTMTIKDDILASTTIDTTVAQYIGVTGTWSASSSSDSARLDFLRVVVA